MTAKLLEQFLDAPESDRLTLPQAAKLAGIARTTLFSWLRGTGGTQLQSVKIGVAGRCGRRYVLRTWLLSFLVAMQSGDGAAQERELSF